MQWDGRSPYEQLLHDTRINRQNLAGSFRRAHLNRSNCTVRQLDLMLRAVLPRSNDRLGSDGLIDPEVCCSVRG